MNHPPLPWVIVGRFGRTIGLQGEIRLWFEADLEALEDHATPLHLWNTRGGVSEKKIAITALRDDGKGWVVRLDSVRNRETAQVFRNQWVVAERSQLPPTDSGTAYVSDLLGAEIQLRSGTLAGHVTEVYETAAHCVLEVRHVEGFEYLIPLTPEVGAEWASEGESEPGHPRLLLDLPDGLMEATSTKQEQAGNRGTAG